MRGEVRLRRPVGHSRRLLPAVEFLLRGAGAGAARRRGLSRSTLGPGSFTGVRVGLSTVQGLALAVGPAVPGPLARSTCWRRGSRDEADCLVAIVDAYRDEVFGRALRPRGARRWRPAVREAAGGRARRSCPPDCALAGERCTVRYADLHPPSCAPRARVAGAQPFLAGTLGPPGGAAAAAGEGRSAAEALRPALPARRGRPRASSAVSGRRRATWSAAARRTWRRWSRSSARVVSHPWTARASESAEPRAARASASVLLRDAAGRRSSGSACGRRWRTRCTCTTWPIHAGVPAAGPRRAGCSRPASGCRASRGARRGVPRRRARATWPPARSTAAWASARRAGAGRYYAEPAEDALAHDGRIDLDASGILEIGRARVLTSKSGAAAAPPAPILAATPLLPLVPRTNGRCRCPRLRFDSRRLSSIENEEYRRLDAAAPRVRRPAQDPDRQGRPERRGAGRRDHAQEEEAPGEGPHGGDRAPGRPPLTAASGTAPRGPVPRSGGSSRAARARVRAVRATERHHDHRPRRLAFVGTLLGIGLLLALFRLPWIGRRPCSLLGLFTAFFFRDPEREVPSDPRLVLSPADGKVVLVVPAPAGPPARARAPADLDLPLGLRRPHQPRRRSAARVTARGLPPGEFLPAWDDKASLQQRAEHRHRRGRRRARSSSSRSRAHRAPHRLQEARGRRGGARASAWA